MKMNLFSKKNLIFILVLVCSIPNISGQKKEFSGFQPWKFVSSSPKIKPEFIRLYMDSRQPRLVFGLKNDWTFFYSPLTQLNENFLKSDFNDSVWQIVRLPHTWMTYETTGDLHPFIMNASENDDAYWWKGWGYYRKNVIVSEKLKNNCFFLEFDGVQKYCEVFVNGKKAGENKGGFNSFSFDISKFIDWNKKVQQISVAVNGYKRDKWRIPPMTAGNWNTYSGIYRAVRLVVKSKIHVPYQGNFDSEGGTVVTTPWIGHDSAVVKIKTFVKNETGQNVSVRLKTQIVDSKGKIINEIVLDKNLKENELIAFEQQTPVLTGIRLWSLETPNLYKVISSVFQNGKLLDCYESPLGFRTFYWDYTSNNLFVNNKKINIQGINRHQEYPWLGDAIPKWITLNDMSDVRYGLGINFMRTAHYPQDPLVYDFNNQNGIITMEEVPNIKNISFDDQVQEQNLRSMIRRDRNNPCVFFWSMGNETTDAADSRWAVEEDSTRIIHARKAEGAGNFVQHTHENLDMENLLRVTHRGWFCNDDQQNGSELNPLDGQLAGSNDWQYERAKIVNGSVRGDLNHNCVGWLYEDHGADRKYSGSELKYVNAKGWVDMYRIPKYLYHLTRANYLNEKPLVFIHPTYWRKKYIGKREPVYVDSNCDEVELLVNGKSLGKLSISKEKYNSVLFENVLIQNGELQVVGYQSNRKVIVESLKMPGESVRIVLKTSHKKLNIKNEEIAVITAYVVDKNNQLVFDASPDLTWKATGEATFVGPSVYISDKNKLLSGQGTGYETVPVSNVIRGTSKKGKVEITVSSPGLKCAKLTLWNEPETESIGLVMQPLLSEEGRIKVTRDLNFKETYSFAQLVKARLSENTRFDYQNPRTLLESLSAFVDKKEGGIKLHGFGYQMLLEQLAANVVRMKGLLIGDDFNFQMQQYNLYLNLEKVIDGCLFHVVYTDLLKKEYLDKIMVQHIPVDYETACSEIMNLPRKSKICYVIFDSTNKTDSPLSYDYPSQTYTFNADNKQFVESLAKAFEVKTTIFDWCKEIVRLTPELSFDEKENAFAFKNNNPKVLVIP